MMRGWFSGWALFAGVALGLGAVGCSSGDSSPPARPDDVNEPAQTDVDPSTAPAPEDISYHFTETPDGMTVSAISGDQVQTLSCPVGTCAGMCSDCAAAACRLMGGADALCSRLSQDCDSSCSCEFGRCGFPVCETNPRICYEGPEAPGASPSEPAPEPEPDPNPFDSAPSDGSSSNNAATPSSGSASAPLP
jgi:hypothetical protein